MELELTKKSRNINIDYPEIVAACEKRGLVPALFLESATVTQFANLNRVYVPGPTQPNLLEPVRCESHEGARGSIRSSYILCARDEAEAVQAFRRRQAVAAYLKQKTGRVCDVPEFYGIDAHGELKPVLSVPMFVVRDVADQELHEVVEYANAQVARYHAGMVWGKMMNERDAYIEFAVRNIMVPQGDITLVRTRMLNVVWRNLSKKHRVEILDDRGGNMEENICSYMFADTKRVYQQRKASKKQKCLEQRKLGQLQKGEANAKEDQASEQARY